jgi:hypothetical protein
LRSCRTTFWHAQWSSRRRLPGRNLAIVGTNQPNPLRMQERNARSGRRKHFRDLSSSRLCVKWDNRHAKRGFGFGNIFCRSLNSLTVVVSARWRTHLYQSAIGYNPNSPRRSPRTLLPQRLCRRCRQRHPLSHRPQLPPHPLLAQRTFWLIPGTATANARKLSPAQPGFLTDDYLVSPRRLYRRC